MQRTPLFSVHTIVLHTAPHFEEVFADVLLRRTPEGRQMFPGVEDAKRVFWGTASTPDGRSASDWEQDGYLLLGRGGGRFDEHAVNGEPRKVGHCSASLVAECLGISKTPGLDQLIEAATKEDLEAGGQLFDIPSLMKLAYNQHTQNPDVVIEWALIAITSMMDALRADPYFLKERRTLSFDNAVMAISEILGESVATKWIDFGLSAYRYDQHQYFTTTRREFDEKAVTTTVWTKGGNLKIVAIQSDDPRLHRYARSPFGANADIVIQQNARGCVSILSHKRMLRKKRCRFPDLVQAIRMAEQNARGEYHSDSSIFLRGEEDVFHPGIWYHHTEAWSLLNGCLTAPDVEPTQLTLEQLVEITVMVFDDTFYPIERESDCTQGRCTSTTDNPCTLYKLKLARCGYIQNLKRNG